MEVDSPVIIQNSVAIFPFECRKVIYSLNSDFFQEGNLVCHNNAKQLAIDTDDETLLHKSFPEFPCQSNGCRKTFTSVHDYEIHYRMSHSFICTSCKKTFPSYNLLDHHLEEVHDNYFSAGKTSSSAGFSCFVSGCQELFSTVEERKEHCIKVHLYPADFKFEPVKCVKRPNSTQMELDSVDVASSKHRSQVPRTVCFGRGAERGFKRGKKAKKSNSPSDINMQDVADCLNEI